MCKVSVFSGRLLFEAFRLARMPFINGSDDQPKKIPSKTWRKSIKKIYEADALCCPNCGGVMKMIRFITDSSVARQIFEYLLVCMPQFPWPRPKTKHGWRLYMSPSMTDGPDTRSPVSC